MALPSLIKMYGLFQTFVLHQVKEGSFLINKANGIIKEQVLRMYKIENLQVGWDLSNSCEPTAILSFSGGFIKFHDVNLAFQIFLRSTKSGVYGEKLDTFLPSSLLTFYTHMLLHIRSKKVVVSRMIFKTVQGDIKEFICSFLKSKDFSNKTFIFLKIKESTYS